MSFKAIVRELTKEIRDGIGSISRRRGGEDGKSSARYYRRGKSHIAPDCSSTSSSLTAFVTIQEQQQSRWANLPPELLLDIIHRVEASETAWPARKDVVACASVCRSWRDITKEIVKTPEQCGSLTFPISLKQVFFSSNKKENKFNSFEPRAQSKTVYQPPPSFDLALGRFELCVYWHLVFANMCHSLAQGMLRSNAL